MKILDAGTTTLSNADVLDWIQRKRRQHTRDDAQDQAKGDSVQERPANYLRILHRTERELRSAHYPYAKNPSVYEGDARGDAFAQFAVAAEDAVQDHLDDAWADRLAALSLEARQTTYRSQQEKKCLSDTELLMIFNHAPSCVEMLEPMIERCEDRFTRDELELIVDVVMRLLRADETKAAAGAEG